MHKVQGGCHCGNISYVAELPDEPSAYNPRSCDCGFCSSHGASYASDRNGTLTIHIKNRNELSRYRLGSRIADFLICKNCGVLTNVCYEENECVYGSINIRSASDHARFGNGKPARLSELSDEERIGRWKKAWFANVRIVHENDIQTA